RTSGGTDEQSTMPSSESRSTNARRRTASSSPVCVRSVPTRNCSPSCSPSKRPNTVCVLPTSIASSIASIQQRNSRTWFKHRTRFGSRALKVFDLGAALADALRERLRRERRPVAFAAQLLDRDVARGVDLRARDHARRAVLVPDPYVLHLQVEERVVRLRDVLHVQLVAEIRGVLGEDAVAEEGEDRSVLLLEPELGLRFEFVELVEVAHGGDCSPARTSWTVPFPGILSAGTSSASGRRANSRSVKRG